MSIRIVVNRTGSPPLEFSFPREPLQRKEQIRKSTIKKIVQFKGRLEKQKCYLEREFEKRQIQLDSWKSKRCWEIRNKSEKRASELTRVLNRSQSDLSKIKYAGQFLEVMTELLKVVQQSDDQEEIEEISKFINNHLPSISEISIKRMKQTIALIKKLRLLGRPPSPLSHEDTSPSLSPEPSDEILSD